MTTDAVLDLPYQRGGDPREPHRLRVQLVSYPYSMYGTTSSGGPQPRPVPTVEPAAESWLVIEEITNTAVRVQAAVLPLSLLWSLWPQVGKLVDQTVRATMEHEARRLAEGAARQLLADAVRKVAGDP